MRHSKRVLIRRIRKPRYDTIVPPTLVKFYKSQIPKPKAELAKELQAIEFVQLDSRTGPCDFQTRSSVIEFVKPSDRLGSARALSCASSRAEVSIEM
ncbi:hypothetical protein PCANC_12990 [Puccinia coronata f. sp. avenae]|uniref:Uncharacterized protein n=1 Tax=Puccinia coronata f. sp. avenae TaxID=200324 RepID=A0A2N5SST1_9BASI|nr:hypothetical protein PCANC_12990 [Puccinia coronata f. sp. avenae]